MNLLVTGGAGFIGSNLIRHIIDSPEIERLVNLDCLTYAGNLENLEGARRHPRHIFALIDLRDRAGVLETVHHHGITHVLHVAAESHVDRSIAAPGDFVETNVVGTFNLLEACRSAWGDDFSGKRFIHVSTDEVYGSLGPEGVFTEASPYAPNSPYSASKAASDMLVRAYVNTYGLPAIITHCSNNYGPYQFPEKLIPVTIEAILNRREIPIYGTGQQVRDWLHVLDHAEALWTILGNGKPRETYNIGARCERTNLQVVEAICDCVDELAPELGGRSRELIRFVADRPGHDFRYAIDPAKVERELGWRAKIAFETGLRHTVEWRLNQRVENSRIEH